MKKKTYARLMMLLAACLLVPLGFAIPATAAGEACLQTWAEAQTVIAAQCNEYLSNNTLCYAHAPLTTAPRFDNFQNPGQFMTITPALDSVVAHATQDIGGFSFMKIISGDVIEGITTGQAVILIAFGDTRLVQINNQTSPVPTLNTGDVPNCTATLNAGSTRFGGSYIRVLPDPQFQIECVTPGCADKDNLLHFVQEGVPMNVKGKNATGSALLVHDDHATGWMARQYVGLAGCQLNALPVLPDNIVANHLAMQTTLPIVSEFRLENLPTPQSAACENADRPSGGLLVINPSHQRVSFNINSIDIVMASSLFFWRENTTTKILVLQGQATVRTVNGTITARSGQAVRVDQGQSPASMTGGGSGNWCRALSELAAAAFQPTINGVPVGVPVQRIDYCAFAPPNGYPLGRPQVPAVPQVQ
jgi:hypothetical protein